MKQSLKKIWQENKSFALFVILMFVFRSSFADWNTVPTGSMKPTILEGDRILVNKLAYDIQLPFSNISLYRHANPIPGDIIVFESAAAEKRLVKRVIGVPGDTVSLENNALIINGTPLNYHLKKHHRNSADFIEELQDLTYTVRMTQPSSSLSSFPEVIVPEGHYLTLGDNRDNSADSRVIGFVPRDEIIGRTKHVVLSLNYDNYFLPRSHRFFHTL